MCGATTELLTSRLAVVNASIDVLHQVIWPRAPGQPRKTSAFASWDGEVVDATEALKWLIGKPVPTALAALAKYEATVKLVPDSFTTRRVRDY